MKLDFDYSEYFREGYVKNETLLNSACYLCGAKDIDLEVEHVIPRIIFSSISPKKYIKLRACELCNRAKGKDDEYIGRMIQGTSFNNHAIVGMNDGQRGRGKGHGNGIYNDHILRSVSADRVIINGNHTSSSKIEVPQERMNSFQIVIAKGLWTTLSNHIFNWNDYNFFAETEQSIESLGAPSQQVFLDAERDARYSQKWSGVFEYSGDFAGNEVSFWIMKYYDTHIATVVAAKKSLGTSFDLYNLIYSV